MCLEEPVLPTEEVLRAGKERELGALADGQVLVVVAHRSVLGWFVVVFWMIDPGGRGVKQVFAVF